MNPCGRGGDVAFAVRMRGEGIDTNFDVDFDDDDDGGNEDK